MNLSNANKSFAVLTACLAAMALIQPVLAGEKDGYKGSGGNLITSVPRSMSYQGILKDTGSNPVADSVYDVIFRIFNVESGGTSLWYETLPCTTSAGFFNALFSNVNLAFDEDYWLELEVGGEILAPRRKMSMVGYAARADTADYAFAAPVGGGNWNVADSVIYTNDYWGLARGGASNILYGDSAHTHVNFGVACTTGVSGHNYSYSTIGGGSGNAAGGLSATVGGGSGNAAGSAYATVGGGGHNFARGPYSVVAGGGGAIAADSNSATASYSVIGGGYRNTAGGGAATVGGGHNNASGGDGATVGGGTGNSAVGIFTTVGGGTGNTASLSFSTVGGGSGNAASDNYATVGGGTVNTASDEFATVSGGTYNAASGRSASVGGGKYNFARGYYSVVAGGGGANAADSNSATANYSAIGGGSVNAAGGGWSTVGGGQSNTASGDRSTVGGGAHNAATGAATTIGGGSYNTAAINYSTVGGGHLNYANGEYATVGGGLSNAANGTSSTVPGGYDNGASGSYSFAAGRRAKASHDGAFVWADQTNADFVSTVSDQFNVRASGGTRIFSNSGLTAGVLLNAGASSWSSVSDSTLKRNIRPVDGSDILDRLSRLPISRWSYIAQDESIEHIGPMAQDFYALFGLGEDDVHISTIDPDGIALAGVKELIKENKELKDFISQLEKRITELENR